MPLRLLAAVVLALVLRAQVPPTVRPSPFTDFERSATLAMLKQVRSDLEEYYYDPTFRGMNLERTFADAQDRIERATSLNQAIATIAETLMRLGDSHTIFLPPERKLRVVYGWQCAMVGDQPFVVSVVRGSDAEKQGLEVGDEVLTWNQYTPARANLRQIQYIYHYVRPQPAQEVVVMKPDGTRRTLEFRTGLEKRESYELPEILATLAGQVERQDKTLSRGDVFVWRYSGFGDPKDVERVSRKMRKAHALVLDLRGNGGGAIATLRTLVSALFDRDVPIGTMRTRQGDTPLNAEQGKKPFGGRVIVLVDSGSGSSAEVLARVVQLQHRGTIVGDRTAGAVMTARFFAYSYEEKQAALFATVMSVGELRLADGGTLEGTGVTPDETILPTGADLAARRDPALARAMTLAGYALSPEEAGRLYR